MSTALLQELHQEVRRLYIAGSDLAPGDFRLKRLLPQFQQLGERAAVFKRLGEGISALVEPGSGQGDSPAVQLQELATLLSSVLYTQGSTDADGEPGALKTEAVRLSTTYTYRKLAEVQTALSTTGSGRYEIVTDAYKAGLFQDLRLFPYALKALSDPYVEIADYATEHILPAYGAPVAVQLIKSFNPAGGKTESRKLRVMAAVHPEAGGSIILDAAQNGSDEVRVTAIELLSGYEEHEDLLLDLSKDKRKTIREAAYKALANGGSAQAAERLYEAFEGKDREIVAYALSGASITGLHERIIERFALELVHAAEIGSDKAKKEELMARLNHYRTALYGISSEALTALYTDVIAKYGLYLSLGLVDLVNWAVSYMKHSDSPEVLALLQALEKRHNRYLPEAFEVAGRILSPSELFDQYAGSIIKSGSQQDIKEARLREQKLLQTIGGKVISRTYTNYEKVWSPGHYQYTYSHIEMISPEEAAKWDSRWLNWFLDRGDLELVSVFARPDEPAAKQFLLDKLQDNPEFRNKFATLLLMGLERAEAAPEVRHEALMTALEDKRNTRCYNFDLYVFEQLCKLPSYYKERLEAVRSFYNHDAGEQLDYVLKMISQRGEI
ncbi:hypothetical protein GCM10010912_32090 [Paenibacillus albidus]|uniref:HEAT repeat domain-containing protein n=1 Tax=Paenibacillus albidus TaxID=2041023 RepID=A0A917CDQ6_9BACL|nr:HEAT repeat domain-containing protein [Paenibacillus albidus]GGF84478.1 hypothetical protein GCM10010912_32090 [Paenibacillus albidus]